MKSFFSKFFFACVLVLLALNSFSATITGSAVIPNVTIGNVTLPMTKAILLLGYSDSNSKFATLYRNGAAYQVTSGKKLIIVGLKAKGSASTSVALGYGDNAVSSTVAPTNSVSFSQGMNFWAVQSTASFADDSGTPVYLEVPSGKYPYMTLGVTATVFLTVLAYEQ